MIRTVTPSTCQSAKTDQPDKAVGTSPREGLNPPHSPNCELAHATTTFVGWSITPYPTAHLTKAE